MTTLTATKREIEQRANTVTLQPDRDLSLPLIENAGYRIHAKIMIRSNALSGFKFRHTGPANPARVIILRRFEFVESLVAERSFLDTDFSGADIVAPGTATFAILNMQGLIQNGPNSGRLDFQWAQNVLNAAPVFVLPGSQLAFERVH